MAILMRCLLLVCALTGFISPTRAEGLQLHEQEIKAGLLYNFLKYIDWPADSVTGQTTTVCIFGGDPFDGYLQPLAGRVVNQREITLRTIHAAPEAAQCQLVFVNGAEKNRWSQLREAVKGKSVLTVSDFDGFTAAGGMIAFGRHEEHINVALNQEAIDAAGLHVQDRLRHLVTLVHGGSP